MKKFLLTTVLTASMVASSLPAHASGKEYCEENIGTCIFWGGLGLIVMAALGSGGQSDNYSSDDEGGNAMPPLCRSSIDLGLNDPLPQADYSAEEGCAWGSRATGTCH